MQDALSKAGKTIATAMQSNAKVADLKPEMREPSSSDHLTSDFGVKSTNHDVWLSASTGDRKGPLLLEDNFGREKVPTHISSTTVFIMLISEN